MWLLFFINNENSVRLLYKKVRRIPNSHSTINQKYSIYCLHILLTGNVQTINVEYKESSYGLIMKEIALICYVARYIDIQEE